MSMQYLNPAMCVLHLPQLKSTLTHTPISKPQTLTWRDQLSNTARNVLSQARVLFLVDDTSDALFEGNIQENSLGHFFFDVLEAFNVSLLSFLPKFHISPVKKTFHCSWPAHNSYQAFCVQCLVRLFQ